MNSKRLWDRFLEHYCAVPSIGLGLDISRMSFSDDFLATKEPAMQRAFDTMKALEKGAVANPDEQRMVGHYWLRAPALAPTPALRDEIVATAAAVKGFAADVHAGRVRPPGGGTFRRLLCAGIGGSSLGPMFGADALGQPVLTLNEKEATSRGLALLALEALGVIGHPSDLPPATGKTYLPNPEAHARQARADELMSIQEEVSLGINRGRIGQVVKVVIDRREGDYFVGRTEYDSPEVDNEVLIRAGSNKFQPGRFYQVRVNGADAFDLYAG